MITIRKSDERGHTQIGWLDSRHSFSFADYYDDDHMGFGTLRVMNEDHVDPGQGFNTHGHRDMEIVSYVVEGELEHRDNTGTGSVLRAGQFQRMTAGKGILHSEFNPSQENDLHFYQMWIQPAETGLRPDYEELDAVDSRTGWRLVASPDETQDAMSIHQDVSLWSGRAEAGEAIRYDANADRKLWLQVVRGDVMVNGRKLETGDGAAIIDETALEVSAESDADLLLFDMG